MFGVRFESVRDTWYHNLEKFPRKPAAVFEGRAYSYAECDDATDRLAGALARRFGVSKGQPVALAAPNCIESYLAYWAVIKLGGVVVPVNTRLSRAETARVLRSSDAAVLLAHRSCWRAVREAGSDAANVEHLVGMGVSASEAVPFEDLVSEGGARPRLPDLGEADLGIVMHTSGTTGRPKGAMMRHGDLLFNNMLAVYAHGLRHEDVHLLVVPMFHPTATYSLLPTSALLGSTLVLAPTSDIAALARLIQKHRVTTFFGVPALFRLLTTWPGLAGCDLSSLRLVAYAGSPMPVGTVRRLRGIVPGARLHNFFGLTETISMTHVLPDAEAEGRPDSIGKPLPHVRQRILDADGRDLPPGEVGELHFHRDNVICAYWKEPDRLAASMRGDWFNTGDLASVDEEGFVYMRGRSKDMIIVGGENVYALEVENCIATLEGVAEVAVVGVPATGIRAHLGELVKAVVVPEKGVSLGAADVKRHCMERLASYKVPQVVEFREELPRNPGGKVLKRLLR